MKLSFIFNQLNWGDLRFTSYGNQTGGIEAQHYPELITHLQLGLQTLFTRFNLRQGEILVNTTQGTSEYTINPTGHDVLKIEQVFNNDKTNTSDDIDEFPINNKSDDNSVFITGSDTFTVPTAYQGKTVRVTYRASHEEIPTNTVDLNTEVYIPDSFGKPLFEFIASRVYGTMPNESGLTQSSVYEQRFERSLRQITDAGIVSNEDSSEPYDIRQDGWV